MITYTTNTNGLKKAKMYVVDGTKKKYVGMWKENLPTRCECPGHKRPISPNDCICSPDDAQDLSTCRRIEEKRKK
jgi:hypothetical protein